MNPLVLAEIEKSPWAVVIPVADVAAQETEAKVLLLLVLAVGFFTIARAVRTRQNPSQAPGARESA